MMKIAVTGATGFIGRHVLTALQATDAEVIAVVRDASTLGATVHTVVMDIAKPSEKAFAQLGYPDVLIHLAWDGLPNYKSLHHFETELPKHYSFLKQLIEAGLPAVVVAGTCFEYGLRSGALSADLLPQPANAYAYAKAALHQQLQLLQTTHTFKLTWARLFYLYGAGQASTSLYTQLQHAITRGDTVFNMSGGEQLRDFLPVEIAAQQLVQLAMNQDARDTVNICSGQPISVRRLVEQWLHEKNSNMQLNLGYYPYPDYEPMAFWGDLPLEGKTP
ncbi:MAG: NAD(P)-dependent oxidoreductase [Methylococcales bacterium]